MIELYIENKKIDLENELEIDFTYETLDPNKLTSIKNSFSKTVKVPGTPNNNITFGHIFRNDKHILNNPSTPPIGAYYDPHRTVTWIINSNGAIAQRGYCTLDSIDVADNRAVTYNLTLYGGLGEFFYSLGYNELGEAKTLKDIYYNWRPKKTLGGYGAAMSIGQELTDTLMVCSASIIANSYHSLNPEYTYDGTTDIDKDVVFVPCYTGQYNDFDSKHMLVSTFNQHYSSAPMSSETINNLTASFPDEEEDDNGNIYRTLNANFQSSGGYQYGLATFSRDIDPYEAGDLRVNELPVAIRLSKLLWALTRPENCGGYEVEWAPSILSSLYFKYGWMMLGKLKQTRETIASGLTEINSYDLETITLNYNKPSNSGADSTKTPVRDRVVTIYNEQKTSGTYTFNLEFTPGLSFVANYQSSGFQYPLYNDNNIATMSSIRKTAGHPPNITIQLWTRYNVYVIMTKYLTDNSVTKAFADVFFFSSNIEDVYFGRDLYHSVEEYTSALKSELERHWQQDIDIITVHNLKIQSRTHEEGDFSHHITSLDNVVLSHRFDHIGTNLSIQQTCTIAGIQWGLQTDPIIGVWGEENPVNPYYVPTSPISQWGSNFNYNASLTLEPGNPNGTVSFSFDYVSANIISSSNTSGFNTINLDKTTLFADSQSPAKYLIDYCKMMNYKFVCDNISKHIYITPSNEYYEDTSIDLAGKVDYSRTIQVKPVVTKDKNIEIGLKSLDTYPIQIVNNQLDRKFNTYNFDTGIQYAAGTSKLFDDLVFKSGLDWQTNSIFYNILPQYPKPYILPTIVWTLFNFTQASSKLDKKEFIKTSNIANQSTLSQNYDWLPKLGLFDKSNKYVNGHGTLVFLNGFVKNYDYTIYTSKRPADYGISPRLIFSNDTIEQYYLNEGQRCYVSDFKYNDLFASWGCYSSQQQGVATSWALPLFTRDLYNIYDTQDRKWHMTDVKQASWNIINQETIDDVNNLTATTFVADTNYNYTKTASESDISLITLNEYEPLTVHIPNDGAGEPRIFNKWQPQLTDIYDRDTREVTLYVDFTKMADPNIILSQTYLWEGSKWVITKIHNFKLSNFMKDKFTKVTMRKINNITAWTSQTN